MKTRTLSRVQIQQPLSQAYEKGQGCIDVQLVEEAGARDGVIVLYDLNLIEDDGPGASGGGREWSQAAMDVIKKGSTVRKVLHVDRPESMSRHLVIHARALEGETFPLRVEINPQDEQAKQAAELPVNGVRYRNIEVDSKSIVAGDNQVVLSCNGKVGWSINLARREAIVRNAPERDEAPARSFKSNDDGQSWAEQLGETGDVDGEYQVRLNLKQYVETGSVVGPVIDLASEAAGGNAVASPVEVDHLKLIAKTQQPPGTSIRLFVRGGQSPVVDNQTWGKWIECDAEGHVEGVKGRFVQWRAELITEVATLTPVLESVAVEAEVVSRELDWTEKVEILDAHNEEILYTSIPFEYERFDEPQLKALREKYRLDEVVSGAKTELEKMVKLRRWVSNQWAYDPPRPPYPAWDAHEILERKQGFCVQYAVVYMQCALSLGMQTRFVFGNFPETSVDGGHVAGHEVDEFWSNEYGKWVMIDAHQNESFFDRQSGEPLSMLQMHERSVALYYRDQPMVYDGKDLESKLKAPDILKWAGDDVQASEEEPEMAIKWGTVRWLPRNNFYAQPFPQPMTQGIATWPYTGYWQWEDKQTPREYRFERYTSRRSDIEWTINQVRFAAEYDRQPGVVKVSMGTVTPDFETFLVKVDGQDWQEADSVFQWELKQGVNRLEMQPRNRAGVCGLISYLELRYAGE